MSSIEITRADRAHYSVVRDFLLGSESLYPGIDKWWDQRVVPGIGINQRVCHAALVDGELVGVSIGKRASGSAKLCTLRVKDEYQREGVGEQLLHRTLRDLLDAGCERVHYTISERVLGQCSNFFTPYGFSMRSWASDRYVRGMDEFVFSVEAPVLSHHLEVMPAIGQSAHDLLISVKPEYGELIEAGRKQVEFRRRFSTRHAPVRAFFYVSSPVRQVRFVATIVKVVKAAPPLLWEQFSDMGGVGVKAFESYFQGLAEGYALLLSGIEPLRRPIPLNSAILRGAGFRPPQSFMILRPDSVLSGAFSR